ncbi:MAG: DNA repair protein RadC [bacterium]|nr:DNA repair protein RadC [bacterium]
MKNTTMKELAADDRPYEKCLANGAEALTDAELLTVILRTGSRGENALELSKRILNLKEGLGVLGLLHLSMQELLETKGIGKVKAAQIQCIGELSKRIWKKAVVGEGWRFHEARAVADYYMEEMRHLEQEELHVMFLNTKNMLIKERLLFKGTVNASPVAPREIFIEALRYRAVKLILVHNHPSGDPTPSREDYLMTMRIKEAGEILNVPLLDHIIIGDNSYISFKERGMLET